MQCFNASFNSNTKTDVSQPIKLCNCGATLLSGSLQNKMDYLLPCSTIAVYNTAEIILCFGYMEPKVTVICDVCPKMTGAKNHAAVNRNDGAV